MIFAAHDMRNAHLNIIDCGGQHIKPGAILTPDHGIADQPGIKMLLPADEVHPPDGRVMIKPEPPVRPPPFSLNRGLVLIADRQSTRLNSSHYCAPRMPFYA